MSLTDSEISMLLNCASQIHQILRAHGVGRTEEDKVKMVTYHGNEYTSRFRERDSDIPPEPEPNDLEPVRDNCDADCQADGIKELPWTPLSDRAMQVLRFLQDRAEHY